MPKLSTKNYALRQTFDRLLSLAQLDHREGMPPGKLGASTGQPWTSADLVQQEALYAIQADLLELLIDVAQACGEAEVTRLRAAMPWAYEVSPQAEPAGG